MHLTQESFENDDVEMAKQVEPLEEVVDMFRDALKGQHVARLGEGSCTVEAGVQFLEMIAIWSACRPLLQYRLYVIALKTAIKN